MGLAAAVEKRGESKGRLAEIKVHPLISISWAGKIQLDKRLANGTFCGAKVVVRRQYTAMGGKKPAVPSIVKKSE